MSLRAALVHLGPLLLALAIGTMPSASAGQAPVAQSPPVEGSAPRPPRGPAAIQGRVVHDADGRPMANLDVALYGLSASGSPGLASARTDAEGRFTFSDLSNQPGTLYIVGARYREVPFGQRVAFEAGQMRLDVEIEVGEPSADASRIDVAESVVTIDVVGGQLLVRESHRVVNSGPEVVLIPEAERAERPAALRTRIPPGARSYSEGQGGFGDGTRTPDADGTVRFFGPFYPGSQEVSFQYVLDLPEGGAEAPFEFTLDTEGRALPLRVLLAEGGARPTTPALSRTDEVRQLDGVSYASYEAKATGDGVSIALLLPEARTDRGSLRIGRADYWLDMDDTSMKVSTEIELIVDGSGRLAAGLGEPLSSFPLPEGAELIGVSQTASALGLVPAADGAGLEVRGPLTPGSSKFGFSYRVPVRGGGPAIELAFDRPVATLNLLIADTGLAVQSERLHRRRPFKSGTRLYLHRQAYTIDPDEVVSARFTPIGRGQVPRMATLGGILGVSTVAALFMVGPLRMRRVEDTGMSTAQRDLLLERSSVYESLQELEMDLATGKLDRADFERIEAELKARAVELIREERALDGARGGGGGPASSAPEGGRAEPRTGLAAAPTACAQCGEPVGAGFRFCGHCGTPVADADGEAREAMH